MKFLLLIAGITALGVSKEDVKLQDKSTLDQIKVKAR
jgi:hypothetical protein